jgi:tripartite-type tricarboxylate transporter receptor subunit TctC
MNAPTRMIHAALGLVVALAGLATSALSEDWPTRPISLVIPFGPGSGTDLVARNLAPPLGEQLGQPLIVQNVGGAGGLIGVSRVAKAAPDGYELVMGAGRHVRAGAVATQTAALRSSQGFRAGGPRRHPADHPGGPQ